MTNGKTTAVVLSGGAAYAAYEVGVLRALTDGRSPSTNFQPLDADIFSGTSAGSFNASIMVSRPHEAPSTTAAYLEDVWLNVMASGSDRCGNGVYRFRGDILRLFEPTCYSSGDPLLELTSDTAFVAGDLIARASRILSPGAPLLERALDTVEFSSFISVDPFKASLRETVDLNGIRGSTKLLQIAATNLMTGKVDIFQNSYVTDVAGVEAIRASSAVPGFFPEVPLQNNVYVDGGVLMNTPISPAVNAGADILHVVYMDPDLSLTSPDRLQSTLGVLDRILTIHFANSMNNDVELARSVNVGLQLLEGKQNEAVAATTAAFLRVAGRLNAQQAGSLSQYRKLTIHRYHPQDDLGGILGMLNFDRQHAIDLINRGYQDAVTHSCSLSGCTLEGLETPVKPLTKIAGYLGSSYGFACASSRSTAANQNNPGPPRNTYRR